MNTEIYTNLLAHPQKIGKDEIALLSAVIEKYPYFQSARALQLKALKNDSSFLYNDSLKLTAAYTTDRDILFEYITSDSFIQNKISREILSHDPAINEIEIVSEDISEAVSIEIDKQIKEELKKAEAVLNPDLFERKRTSVTEIVASIEKQGETEETKTNAPEVLEAKEATAELALGVNKPLEFTKKDTHSFSEWLQLTRTKPIDRSTTSKTETESNEGNLETSDAHNERERKNKLIEKFTYNLNLLHSAKPTDKNLRDDGVYQAFANAYINTSKKFTNNLSKKNFNAMVNNCVQCHEKFCLGTIQKINTLYIRK